MHPIETTINFVVLLGINLAGLWYMLSGEETKGQMYFCGLLAWGLYCVARMVWVDTAHSREMRKIYKEINRKR